MQTCEILSKNKNIKKLKLSQWSFHCRCSNQPQFKKPQDGPQKMLGILQACVQYELMKINLQEQNIRQEEEEMTTKQAKAKKEKEER